MAQKFPASHKTEEEMNFTSFLVRPSWFVCARIDWDNTYFWFHTSHNLAFFFIVRNTTVFLHMGFFIWKARFSYVNFLFFLVVACGSTLAVKSCCFDDVSRDSAKGIDQFLHHFHKGRFTFKCLSNVSEVTCPKECSLICSLVFFSSLATFNCCECSLEIVH